MIKKIVRSRLYLINALEKLKKKKLGKRKDNNMKLENHNIYFIGDGAGKAGNIVVAAATGLIASRNILKNISNNN